MNPDDKSIVDLRAMARAGWVCPRCRAEAARRAAGRFTRDARQFWEDAAAQARAAMEYADFVCAQLPLAIQTMRAEDGLSVSGLATRCGLDRQTVGPVDSGATKPTPHTTARIAHVLCGGLTGWGLHFDMLRHSARTEG